MLKQKTFLIGLGVTSAIIILIIVRLIIKFDGLYGQDSYEYLRYTNALNNFYHTGSNPGDYFWPLYYPILGSLLSFFTKSAVALQFISIASLIISSFYIFKTIVLLNEHKNQIPFYVFSFFSLSPIVFKLGVSNMSDMLSTLFIILFFYNGLTYRKKNKVSNLYSVIIFGISAIMTRYAAFVVITPFGLYLIYLFSKRKENLKHVFTFTFIACLLVLPHFIIRQHNTTEFLNHNWLKDWSVTNFYKNSFTTVDGTSYNLLPNILYAFSSLFHPSYFLLGFLFNPFFIKANRITIEIKILILSFITYGLFLAGIPFQNNRFLLLSFPLIIIILFSGFNLSIEKFNNLFTKKAIQFIVVIIQLTLCSFSLKPILERNHLEQEITSKLENYQNKTLYSFDIDIALQGRGLDFEYKNLWIEKYNTFENGALVLFHPNKFEKQWKGKNPIINWNNLQNNYNLKIIHNLPEGWILFEIISSKQQI